ncbi:hypothetical protein [Nitratiruptor sp. YY09-18]|uniref:hypothetical protein n=1 Tax=Nitratiruptor sp. YY09-18 TaxID=2724901 RepID=UPI001916965E|nr:hypothetical protein [Nitratiruptor sp. YY09-18]BCD67723.1 hypothetical protein NitYY0918_C0624 [Nitratiruptor sp. YY09-18]
MVKKLLLAFVFVELVMGANIFDRSCIPCHMRKRAPLKPIFFDYLLYYSSERAVKNAMVQNLLHPDKAHIIEKRLYRHRFREKTLRKALDIYWDRYKIFGKIK